MKRWIHRFVYGQSVLRMDVSFAGKGDGYILFMDKRSSCGHHDDDGGGSPTDPPASVAQQQTPLR